ncbi:MAG: hypothetical protein IH845_02525 [Nanoarchaeota archaeon]|nr:hypothetical protein [Nanoarchaeota archaeon]
MGFFDNVGGGTTITDVLNIWNDIGVFSYVIPFLLIFAIVFAILQKSKLLSDKDHDNKAILAIISVSVSLLSLQFDIVSEFFAIIFPRFGMGIAILLVALIFVAFLHQGIGEDNETSKRTMAAIGWLVGVSIVIWSLSEWNNWSSRGGFGFWFSQYFWSLVVLGAIIAAIAFAVKGESK